MAPTVLVARTASTAHQCGGWSHQSVVIVGGGYVARLVDVALMPTVAELRPS